MLAEGEFRHCWSFVRGLGYSLHVSFTRTHSCIHKYALMCTFVNLYIVLPHFDILRWNSDIWYYLSKVMIQMQESREETSSTRRSGFLGTVRPASRLRESRHKWILHARSLFPSLGCMIGCLSAPSLSGVRHNSQYHGEEARGDESNVTSRGHSNSGEALAWHWLRPRRLLCSPCFLFPFSSY